MRPEAAPTGRRRARGLTVLLLLAAVLTGGVLRFVAPADLWLDEAQSVAIARLPLPELFTALRQDGAPPLYYLLLHGWMAVFGESSVAVRALSGVLSVLSLPVAWAVGRRLGGPRTAVALVLLLASSPFAIRYGSETRMYSLVILLVLLGSWAAVWAATARGVAPVAAVTLCSAALLLTHYWSLYLLAVAGLLCLAGLRRHRAAAARILIGLLLSGLLFLPWLPSFGFQLAHTGTPWAKAGGLLSVPTALSAWQGGGSVLGVLLGRLQTVLLVLGLLVVPAAAEAGRRGGARLGLPRGWTRWSLLALSGGTLVVAGVASLVTASAVGARYSSVAFPAFLGLAALGAAALPDRRAFTAVVAAVTVLGLGGAADQVARPRTQAGEVAAALRQADRGDTVAFCPDQLGPAVSRVAPAGLDLVVYPTLGPADRVDWTDYAERNRSADPAAVAAALSARAGDHAIWLVTGRGYLVPSDRDCRRLRAALAELRGEPTRALARRSSVSEDMRLDRFPARSAAAA